LRGEGEGGGGGGGGKVKYLNQFPLPFTLLNRISYLALIKSGFPFNRVNPLPPVEGRFAGCLYSS